MGYNVIGFLDDFKKGNVRVKDRTCPVLPKIWDFKETLKEKKIESVIFAIPSMDNDKLSKLINEFHVNFKRVFVVPDLKGICLLNTELYHLFLQQLFLIRINNNLNSKVNCFVKRFFDLLVSILLLPLLVPFILLIGLVVKMESKGPIFFLQKRIGKNGKKFKIIKFRTMYIDQKKKLKELLKKDGKAKKEWERHRKLTNDPRITRVGKILRRTSIDELPQIFNVLKGDMSLVGLKNVF